MLQCFVSNVYINFGDIFIFIKEYFKTNFIDSMLIVKNYRTIFVVIYK